MKLFTMLLCTALAALWVMPASAVNSDQLNRSLVDPSTGLDELRPEARWHVDDVTEFDLFDGANFEIWARLTNASFTSGSGTLQITAYDSAGAPIGTITDYDYVVQNAGPVYRFAINPLHISNLNTDIAVLETIFSGAVSFGLMPLAGATEASCDQPVVMRADHVYEEWVLASDTLTLTQSVICP